MEQNLSEPCSRIGKLLGVASPRAFVCSLQGRRGILTRVVGVTGDGNIALGDTVRVLLDKAR